MSNNQTGAVDSGQMPVKNDVICPKIRLRPGFLGRTKEKMTSYVQYNKLEPGILGKSKKKTSSYVQ